MLRVQNVHTVAELHFEARRCAGVRNLLSFDHEFEVSPDRRVLKALLVRTFSVPCGAAKRVASGRAGSTSSSVERVKHALTFTWVDGRIWVRVYRIGRGVAGTMDVEEIGPRMVLEPVRIIASGFGGAVLHSNRAAEVVSDGELEEDA